MNDRAERKQPKALAAFHPQGKELFRHLDLVPFLRIPGSFDHQGCFNEAIQLLPFFIPHQDDVLTYSTEGDGKWKSLAIRSLEGGLSNTLHPSFYKENVPTYQMTEISKRCPKTISFLKEITDLDQCERIRFMLLEPGAGILPHCDSPNRDVFTSINISLNMPEGCDFLIECNPDGSSNPYTVQVPFEEGDIMILNIAKWHAVVNRSKQPRIHMIVNGPIRFTPEDLLERARTQNRIYSEKETMKALTQKYKTLGGGLPQSVLYRMGLN